MRASSKPWNPSHTTRSVSRCVSARGVRHAWHMTPREGVHMAACCGTCGPATKTPALGSLSGCIAYGCQGLTLGTLLLYLCSLSCHPCHASGTGAAAGALVACVHACMRLYARMHAVACVHACICACMLMLVRRRCYCWPQTRAGCGGQQYHSSGISASVPTRSTDHTAPNERLPLVPQLGCFHCPMATIPSFEFQHNSKGLVCTAHRIVMKFLRDLDILRPSISRWPECRK